VLSFLFFRIPHITDMLSDQSLYALFLTYIPTLCFAKLSILALFLSITPDRTHHFIAYAIAVLLALGGIAIELAAAFQCHTPRPWIVQGNHCYERVCNSSLSKSWLGIPLLISIIRHLSGGS